MKPELRFETMKIRGADLGAQSCVPDLLGESILQNKLEFCLQENDEIYEGFGRRENAYPYRQYNEYSRELKEKEIKTAVLENDYLKAVFLPEYGGRLWELWDKTTGTNLIYTNDVLQFSNLAVRNAWFSGGVEWNIGIIGHCPYTVSPLYVTRTEMKDHIPVLRMYEYERIRKVPYQMDFWLEDEDRFLNCRMRIVNESAEVIPMYWWSNAAVPEYENGRIIVPADKAFTHEEGKVFKVDIPIVKGIDVTDYQTIPRSRDYFFDISDESPKYIANVNGEGYGLLQVSTKRQRSRKLFTWGNIQASDHWQEFLTDQGGRYIEIQAGLAKTQYGCIPMAPHTAWEWLEMYGPVRLSGKNQNTSYKEREVELTGKLTAAHIPEKLETALKDTAPMAKKKAEMVMAGSGYGALAKRGKMSEHLEFILSSDSLKRWQSFFRNGSLHQPKAGEAPDEYLIDKENIEFLAETLEQKNRENWYAHYQAGVGYFSAEDYGAAEKELKISWDLLKNPWACHALASIFLLRGLKKEAADWMARGLEMESNEIGYLKEGFKILSLAGADMEVCRVYERLEPDRRQLGKLKFYYISALHHLGEEERAYWLLEENGGLMIEDMREGEDSIAELWKELYTALYSEEKPVPYRYDFKAF